MFSAGIYLQSLEHLAPLMVAGQHPLDRQGDDSFRMRFQHVPQFKALEVTHVAAVPVVGLLQQFTSGDPDPGRVQYHHKVAGEGMGGVGRFVFALKRHGNVPGKSPQYLTGGVDYPPLVLHLARFREICANPFHYCLHQVSRSPQFNRGAGLSRNDYKLII